MNLIGVSGRIGSGKDLIGSIIQYLTSGSKEAFQTWNLCHLKSDEKWQIVKFADKLKECASIITGITRADFERVEVKNGLISGNWGALTVRKFLQLFGTEVGRAIHSNFWINALFSDYWEIATNWDADGNSTVEAYPNWIITDCRFENEAEAILSRGGIMIRLQRNSNVSSDHTSETALDDYIGFNYYIDNRETTIDQLIHMVKDILIIEKIITKD